MKPVKFEIMQFEELTQIWNSTDMKLDKSLQINRELIRELGLRKIKSNLFEIKWTAIFEIVTEFILAVILVGFIIGHFAEVKFVFPAVILFLFTMFSLIVEIVKLSLFLRLDSNASVVESQKKLSGLKFYEMLDINSLYVIVPFFSAPFMIVFAKLLFNLNLYEFDVLKLTLYSIIGGFVVAAIIVYFLKKSGANKKLNESIDFLNELKEA